MANTVKIIIPNMSRNIEALTEMRRYPLACEKHLTDGEICDINDAVDCITRAIAGIRLIMEQGEKRWKMSGE